MSSTAAESEAPSDAELISRVRAGDVAAYGVLFERHRDAAKRMARQLVRGPDVDDLISEAFTKVLVVLQRGSGPDVAFRAYLLTSIRRLHVDRARAGQRVQVTDELDTLDQEVEFNDPATASFERGAASQAFRSLPERWQLVLWHLEVEGQKPGDIAPLLGMSANSVAALAYRAREGLRQAYLQSHLADTAEDTCRWTTEHLGAYVRGGLAKRDSAKVSGHLEGCRRCTAVYLELTEVNSNLAGLLGPAILGAAAPGYLAAAGGTKLWLLLLTPWTKLKEAGTSVQAGAAAAAVTAVVAVAAVAGVFGGDDDTSESAEPSQNQQSQPAPDSNDSSPDDSGPQDSGPQNEPPDDQSPDDPPDQQDQPPQDEPEQEPPPQDDPPESAPDAPTRFDGDVDASGVVSLRWSRVPDVRGYKVYRSSSAAATARATSIAAVPAAWSATAPATSIRAAGPGQVVSGGIISRTSYRDRSLVDGQRYRYVVTAVARDGRESPVSRPVTVTYDPSPEVPSRLRASERTRGIALRWAANDEPDLEGYRVLRDGKPVGELKSRNRWVDGTVTDGKSYEYEVVAVDRGGQASDPASPVDATYDPVPAAPENLSTSVRKGSVALRWSANTEPDLRRYHVYRDGRRLETTAEPRLVDDAVVDGESYEYTVVAVDRSGQRSSRSAAATATYDPVPAAPRGLSTSVGDGTIRLSWRANAEPDLDGYAIRRDGERIATVNGTSYTDDDVEDGTTYRYQVVAVDNGEQESRPSRSVRETWDPVPARPKGLRATERDDGIALRWKSNGEPDIRSYRVYRDNRRIATVNEPVYDDTDVTDGESYRYTVVAVDRSGQDSERSAAVRGRYDPAPAAPTGLKAEVVDKTIELSWKAEPEPDLEAYVVLRDGEQVDVVKPDEPFTFTDSDVEDGTEYTYQVTARDGAGQETPSEKVTAAWDPAPAAPTHLMAVEGDGFIELTWMPSPEPDVAEYIVRRNGEYLDTVDGRDLPTYTDREVTDGTAYRYRVIAVDASGQKSEPSNVAGGSWDPAPAAPTNLVATESGDEITLQWDDNTEPDLRKYLVLRNGRRIATTLEAGYTDTDLRDGRTYSYRVVAVDRARQRSAPSNVDTATYDPRPSTPTRVEAGEGRSSVELSWAPNGEPDLRGYVVQRNGRPLSGTLRGVGYVDRTATAGRSYRYRVVAVDRSGQRSAPSEAAAGSWSAPSTPTGLDWELDDPDLILTWERNPESGVTYRSWLDDEFLGEGPEPRAIDGGHTGTTTHVLKVVAVDGAGNASEPAVLTFTHPDGERRQPLLEGEPQGDADRSPDSDHDRGSDGTDRPERHRDEPLRPEQLLDEFRSG